MASMKERPILCPGERCTCSPDRYVRYINPPGVGGLIPGVSCRAYDSATEGKRFHEIPRGAIIAMWRVPNLS